VADSRENGEVSRKDIISLDNSESCSDSVAHSHSSPLISPDESGASSGSEMTSEVPEEMVPHAEFDPSQAVESDRWLAVAHAEIDRIATGVNERSGGPLFNVPAIHAGLIIG
jgi:hypothetical protein